MAEVRSNVGTFFMSQYTNFIQFGGGLDGATRCVQVTQLLAAAWTQHSDENPLVVIQLDIVNAYPSADWQAQFNVLLRQEGLPRLTTTGMCTWEMTSPVLMPLETIFSFWYLAGSPNFRTTALKGALVLIREL